MPLNRHPFPVTAFFEKSVVLTYAIPRTAGEGLISPPFELDCYREHAFLAVAFVKVRSLRPSIFPRWIGRDFLLAGYRIFVRYRGVDGRRRRGLQILRSETDRRSMVLLGNMLTNYHYRLTSMEFHQDEDHLRINNSHGLSISAQEELKVALPPHSPFPDWRTARRFAGPMPFTFSSNPANQTVTTVEGVREEWDPTPLTILQAQVPFIDECGLGAEGPNPARLASAFAVTDIPYHWKAGQTEPWT